MRQAFFIFLVCCFVTISVQAQENVIKNTILEDKALLENEVVLENKVIFADDVNSENETIFKNETFFENTVASEIETIPENITTSGNKIVTEIATILKNEEILENEENLRNEKLGDKNLSLVGRIVNGTEAYLGQFPQQVSLRRTGSKTHFCGGSIISLKFILTAAHCMFIGPNMEIQIPPTSITVVAGDVLLQGSSITKQERIVQKLKVHKKFNKLTLENDIAMLQLEKKLVANEAIQVAKLPTGPATPGILCEVSGWGYPSESNKIVSNALMFVKLPLLTQTVCRELLKEISLVPDGMLCAGYIEGGKDACQGDSGGGMLCKNKFTGIVSGGNGCASPRTPGVYTDVYFYRKWIKNVAASLPNESESTTFGNKHWGRDYSNSGSSTFVNLFWLMASILSAFLLSMYC